MQLSEDGLKQTKLQCEICQHRRTRRSPSAPVTVSKDSTVDLLEPGGILGTAGGGSTTEADFPPDPLPESVEPPVDQLQRYVNAQKKKIKKNLQPWKCLMMTKHKV